MDTPGTHALQQLAAQLQPLLQLGVPGGGGDDVVEQLLRRAAGFIHQAHIGLAVPGLQRVPHLGNPLILIEEVHGPANGAVGSVPALGAEFLRVHIRQHALVKEVGNIDHICRNAGIRGVQPGMAPAGIGEAEHQAHVCKIRLDGLDLPGLEIHVHGMAKGAGQLAHQAAGLAEILVLRLLGNPGKHNRLHLTVIEKLAEDPADEHSKSGRGAKPGTGRQGAADLGVKAADAQTQLLKGGHNAPDQGLGRAEFRGADIQRRGAHLEAGEALRCHTAEILPVGLKAGIKSQIYG